MHDVEGECTASDLAANLQRNYASIYAIDIFGRMRATFRDLCTSLLAQVPQQTPSNNYITVM